MPTITDLRRCSLAELDDLYCTERELHVPQGRFRGRLLRWWDGPTARHPLWRPLSALAFQLAPFGLDFDRRCWFFFDRPLIGAGRFDPRPGPSRWQQTETLGLHYEVSRLPALVRRQLYDEVKPLTRELCLGIGGINRRRGGAIFYFALERLG